MINNEMFFIDRPIDFTPNNTLIDHRDYSIINRGLKYLKEYKEYLSYDEDKLLSIAKNIVFFKLCHYIAKLENIDIFDEILDIEEFLRSKKKIIKFYFIHLRLTIKSYRLNLRLCFLNRGSVKLTTIPIKIPVTREAPSIIGR